MKNSSATSKVWRYHNRMKPYVICHSLCGLDGRIQSSNWGLKHPGRLFEQQAEKIKAEAWIVGRRTMQEFASKKPYRKKRGHFSIAKTDFVGDPKAKQFAVAIDPSGKCHWETNMVSTEHVIEVLTEKVSGEYLNHLREMKVSYIFAGRKSLDLDLALRKLRKLFGVKTARVDGGGHVNGSFLKAGLIDELSLVLAPVAEGAIGTPSVFDAEEGHTKRMATKMRLKSVKRIAGGALWLRYKVIK